MNKSYDTSRGLAPDPERQVHDLQVLLEVARTMGAVKNLDELLQLILDSARRVLCADRATLFLYDPRTHELFSRVSRDLSEIRFPADRGLAGAAAMSRQTINIPDAYADSRFKSDVDRRTGYVTRCLLTVPVIGWEQQLVGVMQLLNKVEGVFTDYDQHLAEALAAQIGVALQRAQLLEHYAEKVQMENALRIAREIQESLLPREAPQIPGYDIAGFCRPADQTGGDCYDFVRLPDQRLAITVADASGHGIGPALVVCETRALVRALSGHVGESAAVLSRTNDWLCADLTCGRFVTAFLGILDPIRHRMEYASAGHGPLLWYQASTGAVTASGATGVPLGLAEGVDVDPAPGVAFAEGDLGVFLTDGLLEANNPHGEQFGKARLTELLRGHAADTAARLVACIHSAVSAFMDGGVQLDDFTAVVVKRVA